MMRKMELHGARGRIAQLDESKRKDGAGDCGTPARLERRATFARGIGGDDVQGAHGFQRDGRGVGAEHDERD